MKANLQFIAQKPVQPLSIDFVDNATKTNKVNLKEDETYNKVKQLIDDENELKNMSHSLKQNYNKLLQLLEKQKKLELLMDKIEREKEMIVN